MKHAEVPMRKRTAEYVYNGKPCKRGHVGPRYSNGNCVTCLLAAERERYADPAHADEKRAREVARYHADIDVNRAKVAARRAESADEINRRSRERYAENSEPVKASVTAWRRSNPEKVLEANRRYYWANQEKVKASQKVWRSRQGDLHRAKVREASRNHFKANKWRYAEKNARRRLQERLATPSWASKPRMLGIYREASLRSLSVDHVVPLVGKVGGVHVVCGLHWEGNLRIIPIEQNRSKNCWLWPDMPTQEERTV